jgi:hypothetical protein
VIDASGYDENVPWREGVVLPRRCEEYVPIEKLNRFIDDIALAPSERVPAS